MAALTAFFGKTAAYFSLLALVISSSLVSPPINPGINEKAEGTVRIMSFNIRCTSVNIHSREDRVGAVTQAIDAVAPDSLGVQEATPEWMADLSETLSDYAWVGVGRDDGMDKGEYSAIFYLKDKYEAAESGTFWLSDTPDVPSRSWSSVFRRICTWAVLKNKETGKEYLHMNTHFDTSFGPRKKSIPLILEKAARYDIPVLCTGDFNTAEVSVLYPDLLSGVLSNAKFSAPDTMSALTFNGGFPFKRWGFKYDYILVNNKAEPRVYRVVTQKFDGMLPSDHYPVYTDVIFK